MFIRKLSALIVGCLLVMGGHGVSSQAEVNEGILAREVPLGLIARYVAFAQAVDYVQTLQVQQGAEYVQAVQAQQEADRQAAIAAQQARPRSVPQSQPQFQVPSGGGGDCYAGPIPAYIVTRESGGNPAAMNPSGAYGCFQIMPYVWSANCSDLDRGVTGQIECANRISNGGTNLGPWRLG